MNSYYNLNADISYDLSIAEKKRLENFLLGLRPIDFDIASHSGEILMITIDVCVHVWIVLQLKISCS